MRKSILALWLWTSLFLTPLLLTAQASIQAERTRTDLLARIQKNGIPGISVTVIQSGQEETICAGYADPEQKIDLQPHHRMLSGSIGKTYFATQILKLVEQGRLDLDATAAGYLYGEAWFESIPNARDMTIRQLLNHTSGVPEYVYAPDLWKTIKDQPEKQWTAAERLAFIQNAEAHFPAGAGWSYADANYIILGAIVEKATGADIYELVQKNILDPLKLQQTEPSTQAKLENLAAGYSGNIFGEIFGEKIASMGQYGMNPQFEWTGGGFVTNSADLARWIYRLHTGELLPVAQLDQMRSPVNRQTGKPARTGYGFGAEVFATSRGIAYGHSGFMPGFLSLTAYLPDYDMAVALQVNSDPYSSRMKGRVTVFELLEIILAHYIPKTKAYPSKTTVYLVRHAEKADDGTRDPDLTPQGHQRAENLAQILAKENIDAIYSTPYKRTRQTGRPLAQKLGLDIRTWNPGSMLAIYDIIANNPGKKVLVVGHSNTTPAMINLLVPGIEMSPLAETDYGDLFRVTYRKGKGKLKNRTF